ncbi:MAG: kelch repeat-containing protein [Pseudomonadota bacterium]
MKTVNRRLVLMGGGAMMSAAAFGARAHESDATGAWTPLADMPFAVQEIYPAPFWKARDIPTASLKPKPYNIIVNAGGLAPNAPFEVTDQVTFYDPLYDAWGYGEPLPQPRHHIALVNNNGYLYGVGGFARNNLGGWQMRPDCWRTGSLDEPWEQMTPLPHPQAEAVCASLGGFIHVAGGRAPSGSLNSDWGHHIDTDEHWIYDAASNSWQALAPLPTPRNSAAGAVVNGVLYVIGGRTVSDGNTNVVEVYDALSDRWAQARPMPKAQAGLAAAVLNGNIYVFGGEYFTPGGGGVFAEAWEYNPDTDRWRAVAAMPRRRHGLGAVALDNALYVMGGASSAGGVDTSSALDKFEI